jgi:hypothetical protein
VKTDDWSNRRRGAADTEEAKVVRLRDWLGPEEDLVPIGPRADRARDSQDRPAAESESDSEPPGGSGFWGGDASLQTAIPAPAVQVEPAQVSRARARVIGQWRWPTHGWRWLAGAAAVAALAAVALMFVSGGRNATNHDQTPEASIGGPLAPHLTETIHRAAAATRTAAATQGARMLRLQARRKHEAAVRRQRARAARARQRRRASAAAASTSVSEPVETASTPTYSETATTAPSSTENEPAETTPVETTPEPSPSPPSGGGGGSSGGGGSNSTSTKTPAYGPTGALGPGSSPDG